MLVGSRNQIADKERRSMIAFTSTGIDESFAEACARANRRHNTVLDLQAAAAQPQQQEAHVRLWERVTFTKASDAAEIRRREDVWRYE